MALINSLAHRAENTTEVDLADPLSAVTRKERRNLLIAASVSILMAWAGLVPTRIDSLGVTFTASQRAAILLSAVLAVMYFLVAFIVYGSRDRMAWRFERYRAQQAFVERHARVNSVDPPGSRTHITLSEVTPSSERSVIPSVSHVSEDPPPLERHLLDIDKGFRASTRTLRVAARRWTYIRDVFELAIPVLWGFGALWALYRALGYPRWF